VKNAGRSVRGIKVRGERVTTALRNLNDERM